MQQTYEQIDAMNSSTLKHGLHSMLRLKRVLDGEWKLESKAAKLGTAIHCLVLEEKEFPGCYCEIPDFHLDENNKTAQGKPSKSKTTGFYKSAVNGFEQQHSHLTILNSGEMGVVRKVARIVRAHPLMKHLFAQEETRTEVTLLGEIEGVKCKARLDLINPKLNRILDLKTCGDASERGFGRQFANLHYGFQLAFYREMYRQNFEADPVVNILAAETADDYDRVNYPVPDCVLDVGLSQVKQTMRKYIQARNTNLWPGSDGGKTELPLYVPQWAMEDAGEELNWTDIDAGKPVLEPHF